MRPAFVVLLAAAVGAAACGGDDRALTVFAASSLTEVFGVIEAEFEAANPGVDVVISYAGSATLAAQIVEGAPADVFASADGANMDRVVDGGFASAAPTAFATNMLTIAVEPGNPTGVRTLADLADSDLVVVMAAPEVPAGAYAEAVLADAGVAVDVASYEQSVRSVVSKVALGEADAGLVYRTDVVAAEGRIGEVPIETDVVARYWIAPIGDSADAMAFVDAVTGSAGQAALRDAGFGST